MTDQDIRRRIYEEQKNQIEQDMAPFGFIVDGLDDETIIDEQGPVWSTDMNGGHYDEYGDRSFMWEYR